MFVCLIEATSQHGGPHLTKSQSSLSSYHSNEVEKENLDQCAALLSLPGRSCEVESLSGNLGRKFLWVAVDYVRGVIEETGFQHLLIEKLVCSCWCEAELPAP